MLLLIAIGAVSVVAAAFALALLLPNETPNAQILERTAPDVRDLGIALFAGAAGAFGYCRPQFSAVLAGVAVAVALVPPLCTVGLMLEQGRHILASGAAMLFLTNLIGIAVAATFVFFATGVAHAESRRGWFVGGATVTAAAALMAFGPLSANYERLGLGAVEERQAYEIAKSILGSTPRNPAIAALSTDGALLTVKLRRAPTNQSELSRLTDAIQKALGLQVQLVSERE